MILDTLRQIPEKWKAWRTPRRGLSHSDFTPEQWHHLSLQMRAKIIARPSMEAELGKPDAKQVNIPK